MYWQHEGLKLLLTKSLTHSQSRHKRTKENFEITLVVLNRLFISLCGLLRHSKKVYAVKRDWRNIFILRYTVGQKRLLNRNWQRKGLMLWNKNYLCIQEFNTYATLKQATGKFSTIWILATLLCVSCKSLNCALYGKQEAMENFVFPDEIKAKLMKMSKLMNIFYVP